MKTRTHKRTAKAAVQTGVAAKNGTPKTPTKKCSAASASKGDLTMEVTQADGSCIWRKQVTKKEYFALAVMLEVFRGDI